MKSKIITLRVSEKEYQLINQRASESNLSVSKYLLISALVDEGVTLKTKQDIYRELLVIKDSATNKICSSRILEGCDSIWNFLK